MEFIRFMKNGIYELCEVWNFMRFMKNGIFGLDEGWNL